MANKVNKGEWSEFYAFFKILASGTLYAADENGDKDTNKFYYILSAIKKDIEYLRNEDTDSIVFKINDEEISVPISEIDRILSPMFSEIKEGKNTFEIPIVEPIINDLNISNIKESSQNKGDIKIRVHDNLIGHTPIHSFSIKSYIGGAPTLLNASKGTIFTYEITPSLNQSLLTELNELNENKPRGWVDQTLQHIYDNNSKCEYVCLSSDIFETNLQMIDFKLPEILSEIFVHGYLVQNKQLDLAVQSYLNDNPSSKSELIKYKVNELLVASALGMVPMSPWAGLEEANGGYIIVKDNSEVLCYHLYERNELKNYLYTNTRFETASTSRYNTGRLYEINDKQYIDLALQIRF